MSKTSGPEHWIAGLPVKQGICGSPAYAKAGLYIARQMQLFPTYLSRRQTMMKQKRLCVLAAAALCVAMVLCCGSAQAGAKSAQGLTLLGSFETFNRLGFSPDGVTLNPHRFLGMGNGGLIIASPAGPGPGFYRMSLFGRLLEYIPFPAETLSDGSIGWAIAYVNSGPAKNHYFFPSYTASNEIMLFELDSEFNFVQKFPVTGSAGGCPGDEIVYNPETQTLLIADACAAELIEVTTSGEPVRKFSTPSVWGFAYNRRSHTYFGVQGRNLYEFSQAGALLRQYDLGPYGVQSAGGIASVYGFLYITDVGEPPWSAGRIFIFHVRH
jgi:hypothetical protein